MISTKRLKQRHLRAVMFWELLLEFFLERLQLKGSTKRSESCNTGPWCWTLADTRTLPLGGVLSLGRLYDVFSPYPQQQWHSQQLLVNGIKVFYRMNVYLTERRKKIRVRQFKTCYGLFSLGLRTVLHQENLLLHKNSRGKKKHFPEWGERYFLFSSNWCLLGGVLKKIVSFGKRKLFGKETFLMYVVTALRYLATP